MKKGRGPLQGSRARQISSSSITCTASGGERKDDGDGALYPVPKDGDDDDPPDDDMGPEEFIEGDPELWRQKRSRDDDEDDADGERAVRDELDSLGDDDEDEDDDAASRVSQRTRLSLAASSVQQQRRGILDPARQASRADLPLSEVFRKSWEPPKPRGPYGSAPSTSKGSTGGKGGPPAAPSRS